MEIKKILDKSDELFAKGKSKEGCEYLEDSLKTARSESDWASQLTILNELMGYYRSISHLDQAWEYAYEALEIVMQHKLDETLAGMTTYLNVANIYRASGQVDKAMELYLQVEKVYKRENLEVDYRLGGLYNNMSVASLEAGRLQDAVKYGEQAVKVLEQVPNSADERATVYGNLAGAFLRVEQPDFERVQSYLDQAVELFEKECDNSPHYCGVLAMKAYTAYLSKDLEGSLAMYEKAMKETKKHYGENSDYKRLVENYNAIRRKLENGTK
ncbi:MAG: tetratricopeptide repeat protein [Clostridium sp.]|nr:tetratricopeptide repeat protein [Clostridium sp.]